MGTKQGHFLEFIQRDNYYIEKKGWIEIIIREKY